MFFREINYFITFIMQMKYMSNLTIIYNVLIVGIC